MPPVTWLSAGTRTWRLNALATSTATDVATPTAMYNCVCNSFWRHCWKRFLLSVSMLQSRCLSVCLSVCHVRALCSNGRRYRHDFFCIRQPTSLPDCVMFWLALSAPSFPNFVSKWPTSCWFERRRPSMANYGRMVRNSAIVKMESQWNRHRSLNGTIADPYDLPFPEWGSQVHPRTNFS